MLISLVGHQLYIHPPGQGHPRLPAQPVINYTRLQAAHQYTNVYIIIMHIFQENLIYLGKRKVGELITTILCYNLKLPLGLHVHTCNTYTGIIVHTSIA